jgi:hypothetical protein
VVLATPLLPLLVPPLDEPPAVVLELLAAVLPLELELPPLVEEDAPVDAAEDVEVETGDPLELPPVAVSAVGWTQHPADKARMPATIVFPPRIPTSARPGSKPGGREEYNPG